MVHVVVNVLMDDYPDKCKAHKAQKEVPVAKHRVATGSPTKAHDTRDRLTF